VPEVPVEAVVLVVRAEEVLRVDAAAEELEAVVERVVDHHVVDLGAGADAAEGEPVDLVVSADDRAAELDADERERTAVVVLVGAAVLLDRRGVETLDRSLAAGHVDRRLPEEDHAAPVASLAITRLGDAGQHDRLVDLSLGNQLAAGLH